MAVFDKSTKKSFRLLISPYGKYFTFEDGRRVPPQAQLRFFIITELYGTTLSNYFNNFNRQVLNMVSIYTLGSKLLDLLEIIH